MTGRYWIPKELRTEYLYNVRGLDLIEQCHHAVSSICDNENFWKSKIYYDYTIGENNPMYTATKYTPYQWYVLLTYGLKYDPYLLNEYDYNNQPIVPFTPVGDQEMSEGLFDFLFQVKNDNYLPHLAFENGDVDLTDIYMEDPIIPLELLLDLLSTEQFSNYINIYKYMWQHYPLYHNVLVMLDVLADKYYNVSYWKDKELPITISNKFMRNLLKNPALRMYNYLEELIDIYNKQFEEPEVDAELNQYLESLQRKLKAQDIGQ